MATKQVVALSNLGNDFDIGVSEASKIHVKVDGTSIMRQANGTLVGAAPGVTVQGAIPAISAPAGSPLGTKKGDHVVVTSDGTTSGTVQSTWVYDGSTWLLMHSQPTNIVVAEGIRSYYPTTTALVARYDALQTAANMTAQGFVGVGGATIAPYTPVFHGKYLLTCNAVAATVATAFTVPTSYVRHEVPINPATANTYFIKALGDREQCMEVWVCAPATGVPVRRLAAKGVAAQVAGIKNTIQLSPLEEYGSDGEVWEWLGFEIPQDLITAHRTATNTLRLAIRPGISNGEGNLWYYAGWAVAGNGVGVTVSSGFAQDNSLNGGAQLVYGGVQDGRAYWSIGAGATVNGVRVAVPRIDRDLYLSPLALANPSNRMQWVEATIAHASGNVALGRPRPHIKAPLADACLSDVSVNGLACGGWLIPAATVAAKAVLPANSGVYYLELNLQNRNPGQIAYGTGWVAESVS